MHIVRTSQQVLIAPVGNLLQKPFAWLSLLARVHKINKLLKWEVLKCQKDNSNNLWHTFLIFSEMVLKKGFVFKRVWVHWKKLRFYLITKSPNFEVRGIQMSEKQRKEISWNFPSVDTSFWSTPIQIGISRSQQVYASRQFTWNSCDHLKPYKSLVWWIKVFKPSSLGCWPF